MLREHCAAVARDPGEIVVTHLAQAAVGADAAEVDDIVGRLGSPNVDRDTTAARINAGTTEDHVERLRRLAAVGVQHEIVVLPENTVERVRSLAPVIAAFNN